MCEPSKNCLNGSLICAYQENQYYELGSMNSSKYSFLNNFNAKKQLTLQYTKQLENSLSVTEFPTITQISIECDTNTPKITNISIKDTIEFQITGIIGCITDISYKNLPHILLLLILFLSAL